MMWGLVVLLPAAIGHGYLWAAFFNHVHSTALPRWIINPATAAGFACAVSIPVAWVVGMVQSDLDLVGFAAASPIVWLGRVYVAVAWIAGVVATLRWGWLRVLRRPPDALRYDRTRPCDRLRSSGSSRHSRRVVRGSPATVVPGAPDPVVRGSPDPVVRGSPDPAPLGECPAPSDHHFLARLPGNDILRLEIAERALEVARLPEALDRLTIVHLSDLHFTGRVAKPYFQEVIRQSNELDPDLVAITGDVSDFPRCIEWIPDTLARLTSRYGAYYILGNHDVDSQPDPLRRVLTDSGLVDLGSRWVQVEIRGEPVILAGNELPWLRPAADLGHAPPKASDGGPLRIALAHCPDQLRWARANDVDLLLAGHTHGGQIRIPGVGPLLSASRLGAAYSSGTFHVPPTIMHVSRGISARFPLRFHCPPELVKLVLRTALPTKG